MSDKKQTAIEFLEDKFDKYVMYQDGHFKAQPYTLTELYADFKKAKEIEREQIIDAYISGKTNGIANTIGNEINKPSEEYYNENYNK